MKTLHAKYIWYDETGLGHNLYAMFRKSFKVDSSVKSAIINIFADTAYQLFINGKFIEFGPVRFDPRFPLYDTHDISSFIKPGGNVIAILVNHIGHKTFKSIPNRAGLAAWGCIETINGNVIPLDTYKDSWRCACAMSYSTPSRKLSFALNDAEIFLQIPEEYAWKDVDFDDSHWAASVELKEQDSWGMPETRSIPFMSGKDVMITNNIKIFPIAELEDHYSFSVPVPFVDEEKNGLNLYSFIAFSTWIYSPENQIVAAGTLEEELWINGQKASVYLKSDRKNMRCNKMLKLNKGWNYYFGCMTASQSVMDHYIAFPYCKGLEISADRVRGSKLKFRHSPILSIDKYDTYLKSKPIPYSPEETLDKIGGWIYITEKDKAQNPCVESGWDNYADPLEDVKAEELPVHVFKSSIYPNGFYILMDLGHMHLAFTMLRMKGVQGAVIDVVYGEQLNSDNEHIRVESRAPLGDRIICHTNEIDWLPAHPRGARYIGITVRNTSQDVTVSSITLRSANYPVEQKGWFNCSDPCLNAIWLMGKRTEQANMEDAYVDCSGRERGMYGRDTIIQYHVNLATFGDHALMRRCMELFGQSPDTTGKFRAVYPNTGDYTISDFALNMLEGYLNYYENTGDAELIKKCWDAMQENLRWFHDLADDREDLLLDSQWHIKRGISSLYEGFHGDNTLPEYYLDTTGIHCYFSCCYLLAMQSALTLAHIIGNETDAGELYRRISLLEKSISEKFWDEEKNCFSDNLNKTTHSVHASIFALRAGVVSEDRLQAVKNHISEQLKSIFVNGYDPTDGVFLSPHFAYYIFDGLYKTGLYEIAENIMKQGWGWMLAKGLKTCAEFFSLDYSLCHAWSANPTWYLSKNILGVHFPKAPDMNEVEIRVQTHCVTHAEGAFPHPRGVVEVKWHTEDGERIFDYVKAPDGVKVKITKTPDKRFQTICSD